jgi:hypothetical protein
LGITVDRRTAALLLAVLTVSAAFLIPRLLVSDGVERFRDDRARYVVAAEAYEAAWLLNDNPVARLLLPVARVSEVRHEPGSCPAGEPGSDSPYAQYRARVRFYTLFAIPGPSVVVTCGGWRWMWSPVAG